MPNPGIITAVYSMAQASTRGSHIPGSLLPVEAGGCYFVTGKAVDTSFHLFRRLVDEGAAGLCITRLYPPRVQQHYGLEGAEVHWLSESPGDGNLDPTAVATMAKGIEDFLDDHPEGAIVLLDGVEFIMGHVGFPKTLLFLEHLNETVMPRRATLVLPIDPQCFAETELALLERSLEVVDEEELRTALEAYELWHSAAQG